MALATNWLLLLLVYLYKSLSFSLSLSLLISLYRPLCFVRAYTHVTAFNIILASMQNRCVSVGQRGESLLAITSHKRKHIQSIRPFTRFCFCHCHEKKFKIAAVLARKDFKASSNSSGTRIRSNRKSTFIVK